MLYDVITVGQEPGLEFGEVAVPALIRPLFEQSDDVMVAEELHVALHLKTLPRK